MNANKTIYCCCCRNPDEGLDGGCPCGCHSDAEDEYETDDDEEDEKCCDECGKQDNSVGLATGENGVEEWVCRFCDVDGSNYNGWGDKDNRECCEMCGNKTSRDEWTDYLGNDILYCDDCYETHRVRIEQKCTGCNFRQSSPNANLCSMCEPVEDMTMEELCEYVSNMSGMDVSEGWEREDIIEMIREMK